jgi:hypothetical protein
MEPNSQDKKALKRAPLLLQYAAENCASLPEDPVTALLAALEAYAGNTWSADTAKNFWLAYNKLSQAIKPAAIASIETNEPSIRRWYFLGKVVSVAERSARNHNVLLLILLLLAAVLSFLANAADGLRNDVQKLQASNRDAVLLLLTEAGNLYGTVKNDKLTEIDSKKNLGKDIAKLQADIFDLEAHSNDAARKVRLLSRFVHFGFAAFAVTPLTSTPERIGDVNWTINSVVMRDNDLRGRIDDYWVFVLIVNSVLLPIVLGAMGACAYVVRLISDQIRNSTFFPTSRIRKTSRVVLGALAGVAIGYGISSPDTIGISSSALAFIAGYAIEPLFRTMDQVADKFQFSRTGAPPAVKPQP